MREPDPALAVERHEGQDLAALRVADMVEYNEALQAYSLVDLATEDAFFVLEKPA